jgi:hypothetical protein
MQVCSLQAVHRRSAGDEFVSDQSHTFFHMFDYGDGYPVRTAHGKQQREIKVSATC